MSPAKHTPPREWGAPVDLECLRCGWKARFVHEHQGSIFCTPCFFRTGERVAMSKKKAEG